MRKNKARIQFLTTSAIAAALLSLLCPFVLPIGTLGITLATMVLLLCAMTLRPSVAITATALYLALGAIGLPVFSHFTGGFAAFTSPSGGFLVGYLPFVSIVALITSRVRGLFARIASLFAAHLVLYLIGSAVFAAVSHTSLGEAVALSVLPFLLPDAIKAAIGLYLATVISRRIPRL